MARGGSPKRTEPRNPRRGDAISRQLAVINPQFGNLSPIGGSRRSVQQALGKADRRLLTNAIQQFAASVDPAGEASTRPCMAYRNMTAMAKRYAASVAEDLA